MKTRSEYIDGGPRQLEHYVSGMEDAGWSVKSILITDQEVIGDGYIDSPKHTHATGFFVVYERDDG